MRESASMLAMWNCRYILLQLCVCVDLRETLTSTCHDVGAPEARAHAGARSAMQTPCAARSSPSRGTGRKAAEAAPSILLRGTVTPPFLFVDHGKLSNAKTDWD